MTGYGYVSPEIVESSPVLRGELAVDDPDRPVLLGLEFESENSRNIGDHVSGDCTPKTCVS